MTRRPQRGITTPSATYRIRLGPGFSFTDAAAITTYLSRLGVSHLRCSPIQQAASATSAGYDITDHARIDDRLGGAAGYDGLTNALSAAGIGQVLDIAPSSMALSGTDNPWWRDVLENGSASRYAGHFDVDWDPPEGGAAPKLLMPVLADRYGRVLEAGELSVRRQGGSFAVIYHGQRAPLAPRTLSDLLLSAASQAGSAELASIAADLASPRPAETGQPPGHPRPAETGQPPGQEPADGSVSPRDRLGVLCERQRDIAAAIDALIDSLNSDPDRLDELLGRQNFRLAYQGVTAEEPPYRRFVDAGKLAALRVDRQRVFDDVHRLVLRLASDGPVSGLAVADVDGLADPGGYLATLREAAGDAYIVADKILGPGENLPGSWPVAGTTGYDFLNLVNQLFVDPAGEQAILGGYAGFTGQAADVAEITRTAKLEAMAEDLTPATERLTAQLAEICEQHRRHRDYTRRELRDVLHEVLAAFDVCRCYPRPGQDVTLADRTKVAAAVTAARRRRPDLDPELFDFIGGLLVLRYAGNREASFAVRFAQLSAAVLAKGAQRIARWRYQPLACLAEAGGDPSAFGCTVADFHDAMRYASLHWPEAMLTLAAHDARRGGDVRARISVLSELPVAWNAAITAWSEHNARYRQRGSRHGRRGWPDRGAEHLLYQTLVGAWPIGEARARAHLINAAREAKVHTSWDSPHAGYESALAYFVAAVLADTEFVAAFNAFLSGHAIIARGRLNSLAQVALLLTCPGVPDIYQGTEVWDMSLAGADDGEPADFAGASALLAELADAGPAGAYALDDAGGPKIWLISRLLAHRRSFPAAYDRSSDYEPLEVSGSHAHRFIAFTRSGGLAVIVPRLAASTADPWTGTELTLPGGNWVSVLTGQRTQGGPIAMASLLRDFPVQVLAPAR